MPPATFACAHSPEGLAQLYQLSAAQCVCDMGSGPYWSFAHTRHDAIDAQVFTSVGWPICANHRCTTHALEMFQWPSFWPSTPWPLCFPTKFTPVGEAINPGPHFAITVANPTGLRGKERTVYELPRGIVNLAETHLAPPGMRAACHSLRHMATEDNRRWWLLPGAAVALRARSQSTGVWAGVFQLSDAPAHQLRLPFPNDELSQGRAMISQFNLGGNAITGAVIYAWAQGPTWPQAKAATRSMLQHLTTEVVYGRSGLRYISGDFNSDSYPETEEWLSLGWTEVQDLHSAAFQEGPFPTCKGRTRPDKLFISPELRSYYKKTEVRDLFSDHSAVIGWFDLPLHFPPQKYWPMPAKLPWTSIDKQWMSSQPEMTSLADHHGNTTSFFKALGKTYEDSLHGFVMPSLNGHLLPACRGRAQHFAAKERPLQQPVPRPSRQGEITPSSDFLGRVNHRWFTQLRRIQSLLHNLRRGSDEPTAVEYRLLTWAAIKKAKGFGDDFATWWQHRPIKSDPEDTIFPDRLPSLLRLDNIFHDFEACYRQLESWSLRQRCALLKARREEHIRDSFKDVTSQDFKSLTELTQTKEAEITHVAPANLQVSTDYDFDLHPGGRWFLDDQPAKVVRLRPFTFLVNCELLLCPGQVLRQEWTITDPNLILQQIQEFWKPRWNSSSPPSTAEWNRIFAFVHAHVPSFPFADSQLNVPAWEAINRRYTARSARGPDGFDHLDLVHMPYTLKEGMVELLQHIEDGADWPLQLLKGFCHPLPKHDQACTAAHYRPIVIFPMIYRSWSSMRSKGIIRQLGQRLPAGVRGFLPHREAGDLWHSAQALIECALQQDLHLVGNVTDICKAFEHVPRKPLFTVALRLGLPPGVIRAWERFLANAERYFKIQDHIGDCILSDTGLPEGCSLSVVGMTIIDWIWDVYQSIFAPRTIPQSYVDNLELIGQEVGSVIASFCTMEEYFSLWSLRLDKQKTYFWATQSADRSALRQLQLPVELEHADLGGAMHYCARKTMHTQRSRLDALDPLWARLRRSWASNFQKGTILIQAFWAKAFHAIGITLMPWADVARLRTKAVRALGHGRAGAHPGVRLALLCNDITCDPGGYQLIRVFQDFVRFMAKQPHIFDLWSSFSSCFDGTLFSGPFSKLVEQCDLIWWRVCDPPYLIDHDGLPVNLQQDAWPFLRKRLTQAWQQRISREIAHRADFQGLAGLHWPPSPHETKLTALELSRVNALREGAFLTNHQHSKFDLVKPSTCAFCPAEDTLVHRCLTCPAMQPVRDNHSWAIAHWHEHPRALTEHLLPSRISQEADLRQLFAQQLEPADEDCPWNTLDCHHHLFTDGSCLAPRSSLLASASWAVVSASHEQLLASSPLAGLQQDVNRAELRAVVFAARWLSQQHTSGTIWTDSSYAACGFAALLADADGDAPDSNADLWEELRSIIQQTPASFARVQHVSGHQTVPNQLDTCDEWIAYWNNQADFFAKRAHHGRSSSFWNLWSICKAALVDTTFAVDKFRDFHLELAAFRHTALDNLEVSVSADAQPFQRLPAINGTWLDALPLDWPLQWRNSSHATKFGTIFVEQLVTWLFRHSTNRVNVQISWLELAAIVYMQPFSHPMPAASEGEIWSDLQFVPPAQVKQLTITARIRMLRGVFRAITALFSVDCPFVQGLNLSALRVHPPQAGLQMAIDPGVLLSGEHALRRLTERRAIRVSNDLCRPFS